MSSVIDGLEYISCLSSFSIPNVLTSLSMIRELLKKLNKKISKWTNKSYSEQGVSRPVTFTNDRKIQEAEEMVLINIRVTVISIVSFLNISHCLPFMKSYMGS